MKEIKIFSADWDKHFNNVVSDIKEALKEKNLEDKVTVKIFDVDEKKNIKSFEKYMIELEKKAGITENPVKAVPLIVIDNKPFSLGTNPKFKKELIKRL